MPDQPKQTVHVHDWKGLISNADPHDIHPGAGQEVSNLLVLAPGTMEARKGVRPVTFGNAIAATTNSIITMVAYKGQTGSHVVYEDSAGNVKVGRAAT